MSSEFTPKAILEARDATGRRLRQFRGTITHFGQGGSGDSLNLAFSDSVQLNLRIPHDHPRHVNVDYAFDVTGSTPLQVEAAASLSLLLGSAASLVLTSAKGQPFMKLTPLRLGEHDEWNEDLRILHEVASDLIAIQRETHTDLPMPTGVTPVQRVLLRIVRHAYEGHVSLHPTNATVTMTTRPDAPAAELDHILSGRAGAIFFQRPTEHVAIGDITLEIPGLCFWHPNLALRANAQERSDLRTRASSGEEITLRLESQDGTNLRVYMIERVQDGYTEPMPWGLEGVPEAAGLPAADSLTATSATAVRDGEAL